MLPLKSHGEGPDLVLVHGRTSNSGTWDCVLPDLAGYRVHTVDLLGHGGASTPTTEDGFSIESQLAALVETLETLSKPFFLLGHSMGGFLALRYALDHPHKLRGLVLESTSADAPYRGGRHADHGKIIAEKVRLAETQGMDAVCEFIHARVPLHTRQRANLMSHTPLAYAATVRAIRDMEPVSSRLSEITLPTLVVCGYDDSVFLPECQELAEKIAGAEGVFLKHCGHSPHREAKEAMVEPLLRFLAIHSSKASGSFPAGGGSGGA